MITITCSCGNYRADLRDDEQAAAEFAASLHCDLGEQHIVTGTMPAHGDPDSIPVIVFRANNGLVPRIQRYAVVREVYDLGRRGR